MVEYKLFYTKQAQKDAKKLSSSNLKKKAQQLLEILKKDPFEKPPEYEALVGDLKGSYSRRINIQHRIVYQVYEKEKAVKVIRMWTYYGEWKLNRVAKDIRQRLKPEINSTERSKKDHWTDWFNLQNSPQLAAGSHIVLEQR